MVACQPRGVRLIFCNMSLVPAKRFRLPFAAGWRCLLACAAALVVGEGQSTAAGSEAVLRIGVSFHLVTDMPMEKKGVALSNWITPEMISNTVMPEVNRIWAPAKIQWVLQGVNAATTRNEKRAETIAYLLQATRDSEGHGDPERIRKLESILRTEKEERGAVNLFVVPYLGGTSQGNTSPHARRIVLGQWTDKASRGQKPPERALLVEPLPFQRGSFSRTVAHELGHVVGLDHPARNDSEGHRLMGGGKPGYELTEAEKMRARKVAAKLAGGRKAE